MVHSGATDVVRRAGRVAFATALIWALASVLGALFWACVAAKPRPPGSAPLTCGKDWTWTLAAWTPASTRILSEAAWNEWREGRVVTFRDGRRTVDFVVDIEPWAMVGQSMGATLRVEGKELDLRLVSSGRGACFFLSHDALKMEEAAPFRLVLFRPRPGVELVGLLNGTLWLNPYGGPNR